MLASPTLALLHHHHLQRPQHFALLTPVPTSRLHIHNVWTQDISTRQAGH